MFEKTADGILLHVEIQPNSKKFEIAGYDPWTKRLKIKVKSTPIKGKANKELLKEMEELLKSKVEIKIGAKSTKKTLRIKNTKTNIRKILKENEQI